MNAERMYFFFDNCLNHCGTQDDYGPDYFGGQPVMFGGSQGNFQLDVCKPVML